MEENTQARSKEWKWQDHKPNAMLRVPYNMDRDFYKWWCIILRPFIYMTDREIDVMASFLKQRQELSNIISDPHILDSQSISNDTKKIVMEECQITIEHLYVLMNNLKKKKVITEAGINPKLIPNIRQTDNGTFQLLILFQEQQEK